MGFINQINSGTLPFKLCAVGAVTKQHSLSRNPGPSWNQIIWVNQGVGQFWVDGAEFTLHAGEGVFMRHDVPHGYRAASNTFYTSWVTFESDERLISYAFGDEKHHIFVCPDFLERETEQLLEYAKNKGVNKLLLSAIGYSYVAELFAAITKPADATIDRARAFLLENFSRPLTLDEIADDAGMDKFALCRYFAKHHTCSVMDELKNIRISHAKQLLRYSSYSIEQIGKKCGFESPSYFSLRFREIAGRSPLAYRKLYR